jgi:CRP-like cAMP-binding protein/sugar phosphate permease
MTSAVAAERPSTFAVLRRRNFALMWTGELVSTIGSSFTAIAAGILVYRITGTALSVGLMLMATAAPSLLVGLFAGVFVDRYDRKRIMVSADISRAVLIGLIPIVVQSSVLWLYAIVFASSAIQQFFDPAKESVIPELASDEELEAANSLLAISSFGSTAVGFGAAGLLAATDIDLAFVIDALTFVFSAVCISLVRIAPFTPEGQTSVKMVVANLREGFDFLFGSNVLRSLFVIGGLYALSVGIWNVLLLPFSITALGATEFQYGLQEGLTSIGFVVGSLFFARYSDRLREGQWIALSLLGMAATNALYALSHNVYVAIAIVTVAGFINAPYGIGRRVLIQRATTREIRGRVASVFFVSRDAIFLVGMLMAGLADVINIRALVMISAAICLGAGLFALVLPGIGQPAAEWRRAIRLLRAAPTATGISFGRPATLADFDRLAGHLPLLARLGELEREAFIGGSTFREAEEGAVVVRVGEESTSAYFVVEGALVAGSSGEAGERILSTMNAGDFFGEIAALTGVPRTANVVAQDRSELIEVNADTLRALMTDPAIGDLVKTRMAERLAASQISDLPRFSGLDQASLRELRTELPPAVAAGETRAESTTAG